MSSTKPLQLIVGADARTRRRLIAGCVVRIALTTCSLLAVYFLVPLEGFGSGSALIYFLAGAAIFTVALIWQVRSIVVAEYPGLRAIEAVGLALPLLVIVFAIVYCSLAGADPANFSERLTRVAGLYFTITVLSTVGFGDITAKSDLARLVVSLQMLLDLVIIGVIAKLIVGAARTGIERRRDAAQDGPVD
jgi:voltage-gated potassium channel